MKRAKAKFWFYLMTVTSSIYILWRLFFTLPIGFGLVSMITGIALFAAELISIIEAVINLRCMSNQKEVLLPEVPPELYPDVDVLIATHSEDAELLKKTVNGC
ncbi:MAG: glycosyltransferase, partial [Oscillibacter sp.]|nr:glycosyltransferase [Oscillibacter sp.]